MNDILSSVKPKDKVTIVAVMTALALVIVVVVALLSGILMDNHDHKYAFSLERGEGDTFNLVGECTVDNCEDPYYRENNISGVTLFSAVTPTCSTKGNKIYSFTRGSLSVKYVEELPPIAHDYAYKIVDAGDTKYILGTCRNKNCTNPSLDISGVTDFQLIDSVEGDCFTPRQDTYSCIANGETFIFTTTVQEDKPHTLRGVSVDTLVDENGNFPYGTPGISVTGRDIPCGETGSGSYICDICKAVETVRVIKSNHNYVYSESGLTPPTLHAAGVAVISCTNEECNESVKVNIPQIEIGTSYVTLLAAATEQHPNQYRYKFESLIYDFSYVYDFTAGEKLEHNYTYHLDRRSDDKNKFSLYGKCDQPGCLEPEIEIEDIDVMITENNSTCITKGFIYYSCIYNGEEYTKAEESMSFADHKYSYDSAAANRPSFTEAGSVELVCTTEGCGHTVTVELPPISSENAKVISDTTYFQELEYVYVTSYGCTVTLVIFIYK